MTRRVVVTGGSRGIGRAIVERFVAAGDHVVAVGRDAAALADSRAADVQVCDVTDEPAVAALFERLDEVDVLVNNAGVAASAPLARTTLGDWNEHLAVNATGPFLCTRAVLAAMLERDRGRVVTVASTAGLRGSRYTGAYTASKHAAIGLVRAAAAEVAGSGVTVNAVCPTFVRTEMTERTIENIVARTGRSAAEAEATLAQTTPLGRLLEPAEVADAVVFLASAEAAGINGQCLVLDGGGAA